MNKRRIITSVITIVVAAVAVIGATTAYFSDSETSTGNIFQAGAIDLTVDNVQHYNGMVCAERTGADNTGYMWVPNQVPAFVTYDAAFHPSTTFNPLSPEIGVYNTNNPAQYPKAGVDCDGENGVITGSWRLTDLGSHRFFNFLDIKPGDYGENTISLHVDSNDAWVCAALGNVEGVIDPENPDQAAANTAFLNAMNFFAWHDDGNNIYDPSEGGDGDVAIGSLNGADLDDGVLAIADSGTGAPIQGLTTKYVAVAWCAGTMDIVAGTCDGESMGNLAQNGGFTADIEFYAVQSRNNAQFTCADNYTPSWVKPDQVVGN